MAPMNRYPNPGAYVKAIRQAKAITASGGTVRLFWNSPALDATGLQREIWKALNKRINDRAGLTEAGRKFEPDYQINLRCDRHAVDDRVQKRVRVYQFQTPEIRRRFGHLLSSYNED